MTQLLDNIELTSGPNPSVAVIWMHGLGADGNDFVPIVQELELADCPDIRFVFPHAPAIPVTINNGYVMRAWYDILNMDIGGGSKREDEAGLRTSQKNIEALIEREIARGIPANRIFLAGFSQGCAMTLQVGLRYSQKLAGLICLSGYLPLKEETAVERHAANQDTPIFMVHGRQDNVIPVLRAEQSRDHLISLGYAVKWKEYFMMHSVCQDEIHDLSVWMKQVLLG
jgi:phospholipase/carboxylesterase